MEPGDFELIDGHVHVGSIQFVPDRFVAGIAENIAATASASASGCVCVSTLTNFLVAQNQDHVADELVSEMDRSFIRRAVLLVPDFTSTLPSRLSIEEMALCHYRIQKRHPNRFHVFQGIDPRTGRRGLDVFQKAVFEYHFQGLKLYPPCGYSPSDRRLFPYYEICSSHSLPVVVHTGPTSPALSFRFTQPSCVDRAATLFPRVNFILAHGGVNNVPEATGMCAYRPNVFLDTSGFLSALHPRGWQEHLRELFALGINHKIIFGTDWPFGRLAGGLSQAVRQLFSPGGPLRDLSTTDIQNIMGSNMERLLSGQVMKR